MILRRSPEVEEAEDALLEGDRAITPGTARAALAHREFRIVWTGALLSNVGTWMQNVALGVLAYELTRSATFVAVVGFAQLGPLLFLAPVGGALADAMDRRTLLIVAQAEQLAFSLVLALVARGGHPSKGALLACVLAVGMGNAINAPAFSAILPALVGPADLGGAVSLQSVQMNVSRVVGPAIGGLLLPRIGAAGVFTVNAMTYFFAIGGLLLVRLPHVAAAGGQGLRRLLGGFAAARENRLVGRCLLTVTTVSFFCLPFIGLMPVLAARNFHINPRSTGYGFLYAAFGVGAALGAISVGTVLVQRSRARLVRSGLVSFGATLAAFALVRSPAPAYVLAFLVGLTYFTTITSLSTHLQENVDDGVRGRVMALWIMGFGGTVPIGLLVGGAVANHTSITAVVLVGAAIALGIAALADLRPQPAR